MWSLPNIQAMNAVAEAQGDTLLKNAAKNLDERGEPLPCIVCDWSGDETTATESVVFFDIFSDDPKGVYGLCEEHEDEYVVEGYFICDQCGKVHVENYTWERYEIVVDEEAMCLNCGRERVLSDEGYWFDPAAVKTVLVKRIPEDRDEIRVLDDEGNLYIGGAKHLIAVGQNCPPELEFVQNIEFDTFSGRQISGDDPAEVFKQMAVDGVTKCCIILDAAYQFAASVGIYTPAESEGKE